MSDSNAYGTPPANRLRAALYTQAEVDAMVGSFGRNIALLNAALEESDQLARAGERVGYESAFRTLRRVVAQVLESPPPTARISPFPANCPRPRADRCCTFSTTQTPCAEARAQDGHDVR